MIFLLYQLSHINIQNSIALDWFLDNHDSVDDDDDGDDGNDAGEDDDENASHGKWRGQWVQWSPGGGWVARFLRESLPEYWGPRLKVFQTKVKS